MRRLPRVNYDEIADLYDAQPYRARMADPELLAFAGQRASADPAALDIGCGTGNQLIANRAALPHAWYAGLDRSFGMLRQARLKAPELAWLRADGAALPFAARSFDFVCCQFAFHHLEDKAGMLRAVLQVLRPGGRFVLRNMCPQEFGRLALLRIFPGGAAGRSARFLVSEYCGRGHGKRRLCDGRGGLRARSIRAKPVGVARDRAPSGYLLAIAGNLRRRLSSRGETPGTRACRPERS